MYITCEKELRSQKYRSLRNHQKNKNGKGKTRGIKRGERINRHSPNWHMMKYSSSLNIKELLIKVKSRDHLSSIRVTYFKSLESVLVDFLSKM